MLKKTITYPDYNGGTRTEDFYFNFTEAEVMELQMGTDGGLSAMLQRIVAAQDMPSLIKVFKELILKAYGVKTPDGKGFIKNDKVREEFESTQAFSMLFMELCSDTESASKFVKGIVPASMAEEAAKVVPVPQQ